MTNASNFTALHYAQRPFLLPNAWDVASAVLLADAGFPAIGTTSLGVTAAAGLPDGVSAGRDLTLALVHDLVRRLSVPLTVDLEGGYSDDPPTVAALATELAGLGVAGINLEDGRSDGGLRRAEEHAAVISAVAIAAPELFINARTDTYWLSVGPDDQRLDETLHRLAVYRHAGATGVFIPGLTDLADTATVVKSVALPVNVLCRPDGDLSALAAVGVARVSTGSSLYRHALAAAVSVADAARGGRRLQRAEPVDYAYLQNCLSARRETREPGACADG